MTQLHCSFCPFRVAAWATSKQGQPVNGHAILRAHVGKKHPKELAVIRRTFGELRPEAIRMEVAGQ